MSIPSIEGGTGAGTEVLRRSYTATNNNAYAVLINGVADHLYTVLSITICETGGNAEDIGIRVMIDGSTELKILETSTTIPARSTYIFNDKLVLAGEDHLEVFTSAGDCDIYCSYIDQTFA